MRNYEAQLHKVEAKELEKLDPGEKLAGLIAIAALAHLVNGPESPTERKKGRGGVGDHEVEHRHSGQRLERSSRDDRDRELARSSHADRHRSPRSPAPPRSPARPSSPSIAGAAKFARRPS